MDFQQKELTLEIDVGLKASAKVLIISASSGPLCNLLCVLTATVSLVSVGILFQFSHCTKSACLLLPTEAYLTTCHTVSVFGDWPLSEMFCLAFPF